MAVETDFSLPKWPFYLANALLVALAAWLALSGEPPRGWGMAGIAALIGLGFILSPLPHVLEYATRLRLREIEASHRAAESAQRLETAWLHIRETAEEVHRDLDLGRKTMGEITAAIEKLEAVAGDLEAFRESLAALSAQSQAGGTAAAPNTAAPARPPGQPAGTESQPAGTEPQPDGEPLEEDAFPDEPAERPTPAAPDSGEDEDWLGEGWSEDEIPQEPLERTNEAPERDEATPARTPGPGMAEDVPEPAHGGPQETGEAASGVPSQTELIDSLPGSTKPGKQHAARRAGQTRLTAYVLIGIGNKPYLRGEGPGLSEARGVPMEFVEIGKWAWTAPETAKPISCRILKNDEIPAEGEPITLQPGESVEVTPRFPA